MHKTKTNLKIFDDWRKSAPIYQFSSSLCFLVLCDVRTTVLSKVSAPNNQVEKN